MDELKALIHKFLEQKEELSSEDRLYIATQLLGCDEAVDNDQQIILYTGLMRDGDGAVVPFQ